MDYEGFFQLIRNRRSIRAFSPEKQVSDEQIERILEAGRVAPTASNKQPGRVHLVRDSNILRELHRSYPRDWFSKAPAVLVISGNREDAWVRSFDGYNSLEIDIAIMMDHMILAAESEGVSTCWIIAFEPEIVRNALSLGKNEIPFVMTPLGFFPDGYEKREMPERKSLVELVTYY
jgi:nitroreductase